MEVAALRTTPLGWPGSALWCVDTRTLTSVVPDRSVHRCGGDELRLAQKLLTIRCDSFIMLRFPSGVTPAGSLCGTPSVAKDANRSHAHCIAASHRCAPNAAPLSTRLR
uniref:Uncharacterized protein n=1 Tax=Arundo donax TaxID=35708 RepID=A0A0A9CRH0_ARUDO